MYLKKLPKKLTKKYIDDFIDKGQSINAFDIKKNKVPSV